jgi:hypothetical protein
MSDHFDWRTDDEVWANEPIIEPELETPVSRRRSWIIAVIIVILLLGAGTRLYRYVNNQIEAAQIAAESEILLTHGLLRQANLEQDVELFRSFLSGRDPTWTELQLEQVARGRLFDRDGLGLQAQPDVANIEVNIAPDLQAAELRFEQFYALQNARGLTQTVHLQQTAVYRRGNQQWLYAPPAEAYWGGWQTWDGRQLAIAYRQRDQAIVEQLAFDFEALIAEVCQLPDMACPPDLHLHLRLDSSPESLLLTADAQTLLEQSLRLNLPSPSLVGLPVDEAGYQALLQGYSLHLAAALISQQIDYQCCSPELLHRALLDWHLYQLGLRPWPLTAAHYDQLIYQNVRPEDFRRFWHVPVDHNWLDVYILVQFLATDPSHLSPVAGQRLLNGNLTYDEWLSQVAGENANTALIQFIAGQTTRAQPAEPPVPWPQEDILYVCRQKELQRYDFQGNVFADVSPMDDAARIVFRRLWPLADGYLVVTYYFDSQNDMTESQLMIVDGNGRRSLFDSRQLDTLDESTSFNTIVDPNERYFLLTSIDPELQATTFTLLDSADCENDTCQLYPISSWPLWSPSGQALLLTEPTAVTNLPDYAPLYLADERGQNRVRLAENARAYAWLDDRTIAYVRLDEEEQLIVTRDIGSNLERVIARNQELRLLLPEPDTPQSLPIATLEASPTNPDLILVTTTANEQWNQVYSFLLERREEEVGMTLVPQELDYFYGRFSPNGRFILSAHIIPASSSPGYLLNIYDLETARQRTVAARDLWPDWSADGNWLVLLFDQYLILTAPAYDYNRVIVGDFANCGNVIWVDN